MPTNLKDVIVIQVDLNTGRAEAKIIEHKDGIVDVFSVIGAMQAVTLQLLANLSADRLKSDKAIEDLLGGIAGGNPEDPKC